MKLSRQPWCELRILCDGEPANEVDHIDGDPRNNASDNLRSACKSCHSHRTIHDQGLHAYA